MATEVHNNLVLVTVAILQTFRSAGTRKTRSMVTTGSTEGDDYVVGPLAVSQEASISMPDNSGTGVLGCWVDSSKPVQRPTVVMGGCGQTFFRAAPTCLGAVIFSCIRSMLYLRANLMGNMSGNTRLPSPTLNVANQVATVTSAEAVGSVHTAEPLFTHS